MHVAAPDLYMAPVTLWRYTYVALIEDAINGTCLCRYDEEGDPSKRPRGNSANV
jgi:hypothetical protein